MKLIKNEQELPLLMDAKNLQALGFSRSVAYQLLNRADIPVIKVGGRKFVNRNEFFAWLNAQRAYGGQT